MHSGFDFGLPLLPYPTDYDPKKSFALRAIFSAYIFFLPSPSLSYFCFFLFCILPIMTPKNRSRCARPKVVNSYYNFIMFWWISGPHLQWSIQNIRNSRSDQNRGGVNFLYHFSIFFWHFSAPQFLNQRFLNMRLRRSAWEVVRYSLAFIAPYIEDGSDHRDRR